MNSNKFPFSSLRSFIILGSCAKNDPSTTLNRNEADSATADQNFNANEDGFSPAGSALSGNLSDEELLTSRNPGLEAFSDPLNVIRPFDPVFWIRSYNISGTEDQNSLRLYILEGESGSTIID